MDKNLRSYVAELIGTFALVFLSAGTVCAAKLTADPTQPQPYLVGIALAQGFILAAMLSVTASVSGGYLNPAITLMFWVFKRLDGKKACWLVGAQAIGAVLAGLCLRFLFSEQVLRSAQLGTPHLNMLAFQGSADADPTFKTLLSGIGIEIVLTFIVTFVIFGTIIDPRGPEVGGLGAGLALTACVLMGFDLTGAAVNPARWFGPAVWEVTINSRAFRDHAVYWIGPVVGALLAGGVYLYVILPEDQDPARPSESATAGSESSGLSTLFRAKK